MRASLVGDSGCAFAQLTFAVDDVAGWLSSRHRGVARAVAVTRNGPVVRAWPRTMKTSSGSFRWKVEVGCSAAKCTYISGTHAPA